MEQIVRIVTDSSCDLPQRLVEKFKIAVVPLVVRFGTQVYQDGELSMSSIMARVKKQSKTASEDPAREPMRAYIRKNYRGSLRPAPAALENDLTSGHLESSSRDNAALQGRTLFEPLKAPIIQY